MKQSRILRFLNVRSVLAGLFCVVAPLLTVPAWPAADPFHQQATPEAAPAPADLHPIQYADGQSTSNDRCPVRKRPLNTKIEPVYVNGHPVGFC